MNISDAKKYFQQNPDAVLVIVPRRYKYVMQVHKGEFIKTIKSRIKKSDISCNTLEEINKYAKKLNKFNYDLIQNCPHVEMSGLDKDVSEVAPRSDVTKIII
ncbi:MAG: putative transcriptional regulator [Francisellaceae bacterium]|jgi:predicted transcriptional regulator